MQILVFVLFIVQTERHVALIYFVKLLYSIPTFSMIVGNNKEMRLFELANMFSS